LIKNRKCECVNAVITDRPYDKIKFANVRGNNMLSGLYELMNERQKGRILREKHEIEYIDIKALAFNGLFGNDNHRHIDFMSLDVEGGELSVLKAIDFNRYSFGLITIEWSNKTDKSLVDFMKKNGYKIYMELEWDTMFVPIV
jgi:hypothetical protein